MIWLSGMVVRAESIPTSVNFSVIDTKTTICKKYENIVKYASFELV